MLPTSLTIPPVGAVAPTGPAVAIGDGRQAAFQRALQSLVGQSVTGEVLARFQDGSFMVNVADHGVRMQLPADASIGSRLPLTVLSAEPRASFELHQPSASVVLYGEAHASDGTADLYSPAPHASPASPAGAPGASGNAHSASNPASSALAQAAASSATNSAGSSPASLATTSPGAGGPPPAGTGATPAAGMAAQLAAGAAANPANPALLASLLAAAGTPASQRNAPTGRLTSPASTGADSAALFAGDGADPASLASGASASSTAAHAASAGNAAARAHSSAASLLGKAPLTPLAELPGLDAGTAQPELSGAARMLGSLLSQPNSASALPLLGKTALFGHAAPDPAQLAQTLQSSIEDSGLFYESHLAAWARGERSLEQLQREPQMQTAQQAAQQGLHPDGAAPDRTAAQQINQQLLAQEQGRLQWQGESWPGQPIQWEIQRQPGAEQRDGRAGSDDAPASIWRSSLRLRFAALGNLSATITMVGQQVHLQLLTDVDDSAATLRAQAPVLSASMAAAGIPLSSLSIDQDDTHDG